MADAAAVPFAVGTQGCRVELFGTARLAAGVREVILPLAATCSVGELVSMLAGVCPLLADAGIVDVSRGVAGEGYLFNRDGREFLTRCDLTVAPGDHLLLLSSAVGG